jgi:hypothetical protein
MVIVNTDYPEQRIMQVTSILVSRPDTFGLLAGLQIPSDIVQTKIVRKLTQGTPQCLHPSTIGDFDGELAS